MLIGPSRLARPGDDPSDAFDHSAGGSRGLCFGSAVLKRQTSSVGLFLALFCLAGYMPARSPGGDGHSNVATTPRPAPASRHAPSLAPVQVLDIALQSSRFIPSIIHVKQGSRVQLRVVALDRSHGIRFNVFPDGVPPQGPSGLDFTGHHTCWRIAKGQPAVIEFVARRVGSYPAKCCVICGLGHLGMKARIIVDP